MKVENALGSIVKGKAIKAGSCENPKDNPSEFGLASQLTGSK